MKVSKSGLFLFELIIVIFLFTVSAAICISIFASSYNFSTDSENLTMSSIKAETAAEVFKDSDGNAGSDAQAIIDALGAGNDTYDIIIDEGTGSYGDFTLNLYFDKQWRNTDDLNKAYVLTVNASNDIFYKRNQVVKAAIKTTDGDKTIFDIGVSKTD